MGIALGRVRISYDDFCRCTPVEFEEVCKAWQETRDAEYKESWERTRLLATITIQPHVKQKLTAHKLLPFAWDNEQPEAPQAKQMTAEQRRKRMDEIAKKLGTTA